MDGNFLIVSILTNDGREPKFTLACGSIFYMKVMASIHTFSKVSIFAGGSLLKKFMVKGYKVLRYTWMVVSMSTI